MIIPKDKVLHFSVCLMVALATSSAAWLTSDSLMQGCNIGIALTAGLALGKEYGDKNATGNHWCWWDLLADLVGILVAVGLLMLGDKLLEELIK